MDTKLLYTHAHAHIQTRVRTYTHIYAFEVFTQASAYLTGLKFPLFFFLYSNGINRISTSTARLTRIQRHKCHSNCSLVRCYMTHRGHKVDVGPCNHFHLTILKPLSFLLNPLLCVSSSSSSVLDTCVTNSRQEQRTYNPFSLLYTLTIIIYQWIYRDR